MPAFGRQERPLHWSQQMQRACADAGKKYVKGSVQKINCVQWWISQFLNIIFALHLDISPYKQV